MVELHWLISWGHTTADLPSVLWLPPIRLLSPTVVFIVLGYRATQKNCSKLECKVEATQGLSKLHHRHLHSSNIIIDHSGGDRPVPTPANFTFTKQPRNWCEVTIAVRRSWHTNGDRMEKREYVVKCVWSEGQDEWTCKGLNYGTVIGRWVATVSKNLSSRDVSLIILITSSHM